MSARWVLMSASPTIGATEVFTGIVEARGRVENVGDTESGSAIRIRHPEQGRLQGIRPGDSIAVSGVCLTAGMVEEGFFSVDLSKTTLGRTTLGNLKVGDEVNLEPALRVGEPMGGHLVSGHVDAVGTIVAIKAEGDCSRTEVEAPAEVHRYLVPRGSICVDGVSLTVTDVGANTFSVTLIPHTRAVSLAGDYRAGMQVNLEVDMLARYLERLLEERIGS